MRTLFHTLLERVSPHAHVHIGEVGERVLLEGAPGGVDMGP